MYIIYIVYIRERCCFLLCVHLKRVVDNLEVKVDVQKGPLRFKEKIENRCPGFIQFTLITK